jgi:hypothetical protein
MIRQNPEAEGLIQKNGMFLHSLNKKNCPHILNLGDSRSTKMFHGEHYSRQTLSNSSFPALSTNVNNLKEAVYSLVLSTFFCELIKNPFRRSERAITMNRPKKRLNNIPRRLQ